MQWYHRSNVILHFPHLLRFKIQMFLHESSIFQAITNYQPVQQLLNSVYMCPILLVTFGSFAPPPFQNTAMGFVCVCFCFLFCFLFFFLKQSSVYVLYSFYFFFLLYFLLVTFRSPPPPPPPPSYAIYVEKSVQPKNPGRKIQLILSAS